MGCAYAWSFIKRSHLCRFVIMTGHSRGIVSYLIYRYRHISFRVARHVRLMTGLFAFGLAIVVTQQVVPGPILWVTFRMPPFSRKGGGRSLCLGGLKLSHIKEPIKITILHTLECWFLTWTSNCHE